MLRKYTILVINYLPQIPQIYTENELKSVRICGICGRIYKAGQVERRSNDFLSTLNGIFVR